MEKQTALNILSGCVSRSYTNDSTQTKHIVVGESLERVDHIIEQEIDAALKKGQQCTWGGKTIWIEHRAFFDGSKSGSEQYVWDKSGNKVKHAKIKVTRWNETGHFDRETVGTSFRAIDY